MRGVQKVLPLPFHSVGWLAAGYSQLSSTCGDVGGTHATVKGAP